MTPPSGYAAVTGSPVKLGDADLLCDWHAYSTGDPTTVAFGFTGVTDGLWESVGYENASSTFDGTPTTNTSATGAVQCPSITVAGNSDRLVLFGDAYISGTVLSFSYTSALTQQAITNEGPDRNWITEADAALSPSGSTGAAIMTASGGTPGYMACLMLALESSGLTPTPTPTLIQTGTLTPIPTESPTPMAYVPTQTPIPTSTPTFYVPTPTPTPTPMATATPLSCGAPVLRATNSGTIPYLSGGFNCVLPAGTANGDMVFCGSPDPDAGTVTPPSGYAAVTGSPVKLGDADLYVYWHAYLQVVPRLAFGFTGVTDGLWESVGYENASSTFDGTPTTNTSATGAVQCPSITVAGNSDRLVLFGDAYISGTVLSFSYTSALTQQAITNEGPDWNWITEADAALSSSGSTGAAIMTASGGTPGYMACLMLALESSGPTPTPTPTLIQTGTLTPIPTESPTPTAYVPTQTPIPTSTPTFYVPTPTPTPTPMATATPLSYGAPVLRATNSGTIPYLSGGFNCVLPAGTANGDMVFCAFQDPDAGTVTPPSGYAAVTGSPVKLGDADLYVYWHAYSTGDPTTVAFGFTGVTDGLWESVGYENVASTFDGTPTTNTSATGAVQCPSITVAGNSDRLVLFGDAYISGTVLSFSYTSALTQQAITNEGPDWNWITEADAALSSSGSTGAAIMTASGGTPGYMACLMLALESSGPT